MRPSTRAGRTAHVALLARDLGGHRAPRRGARRSRPDRDARRGCRRSRPRRAPRHARAGRRASRTPGSSRAGRRGPVRTPRRAPPPRRARPTRSAGARCAARTRAARPRRARRRGHASPRRSRSSSSARRGSRRRGPRRAAPVSPSFHERKLRPSSASTTPLTTPPKRVAIPPARTTWPTRPAASASSPAARAAAPAVRARLGQRLEVVAARAARRRRRRRSTRPTARRSATRARSSSNRTRRSRTARAVRRLVVDRLRLIARPRPPAAGSPRTGRGGRRARSRSRRRASAGVTSKAGLRAGNRGVTSAGSRSSIGIAAPVGSDGSSVEVGATTTSGRSWWAASTASAYVPILFATSPFAAIRSAPVTTRSTSPRAMNDAAAASAITVCAMPSCSSSQAVSRLPWRSGRVSSTQTCSTRPASAAARIAPSAEP